MIKLIRVDHRLLHGQVVFSWTKSQGIERIIVIDNATSKDDFKKMSLKMAKPEGIRLNVFSVEGAVGKLDQIKALKANTMLLFGNVTELYRFMQSLGKVDEINYGGIPERPKAKRYSNAVFLTDEEVEMTKKLCDMGITVSMQQVPTARKEVLNEKL